MLFLMLFASVAIGVTNVVSGVFLNVTSVVASVLKVTGVTSDFRVPNVFEHYKCFEHYKFYKCKVGEPGGVTTRTHFRRLIEKT